MNYGIAEWKRMSKVSKNPFECASWLHWPVAFVIVGLSRCRPNSPLSQSVRKLDSVIVFFIFISTFHTHTHTNWTGKKGFMICQIVYVILINRSSLNNQNIKYLTCIRGQWDENERDGDDMFQCFLTVLCVCVFCCCYSLFSFNSFVILWLLLVVSIIFFFFCFRFVCRQIENTEEKILQTHTHTRADGQN